MLYFCAHVPFANKDLQVHITVEATVFYVHRDLLIFASPFFECLLRGDWRETQSFTSTRHRDSIIGSPTQLQPGMSRQNSVDRQTEAVWPVPLDPNDATPMRNELEDSFLSVDPAPEQDEEDPAPATLTPAQSLVEEQQAQNNAAAAVSDEQAPSARNLTPTRPGFQHLQPRNDRDAFTNARTNRVPYTPTISSVAKSFAEEMEDCGVDVEDEEELTRSVVELQNDAGKRIDARIKLTEERAAAFSDVLHFIYPQYVHSLLCSYLY